MSSTKRLNLNDSDIRTVLKANTDIEIEEIEKETQRKGAKELARALVRLRNHFGTEGFEKAKELMTSFYAEVSGKRAMDRQIIQASKLLRMLGIRDEYGEEEWRDLKVLMNEKDWSQNYQRFNFYVLKNLAKITKADWPWYIEPPEKPKEQDMTKPVMPTDILENAIEKARKVDMDTDKGLYDNKDVFCLAVSSTYGVRRIEISRLSPELIHEDSHEIEIHTAKKGEYRTHLIPEPIRPYIYNFNIGARLGTSRATMSRIFHDIFDRLSSDIRNSGRYQDGKDPWGWHSIRRRLITDFENMREGEERERVFSRNEMINFFRWSEADPTMLSTYARKDKEVEDLDNRVVDEKFFEKHPYIGLWK